MPPSAITAKRPLSKKAVPRSLSPQPSSKSKGVRSRSGHPTRVAIIGGGKGGKALMEIFAQDPLARIVGLAESKPRTSGTKLAQQFGVPVIKDYRDLLKRKDVDLIIDVTGNPKVELALLKVRRPNLAVIGGASAKFMWQLIEARIRATTEIEKTLTRYQSLFQRFVKEEAERAVHEERTRIACEIHDGLVQTLVGVNFKMELCAELVAQNPTKSSDLMREAKAQLKHGIQETRQVVFNLRPGQEEKLDLFSALSNFLKSFEEQHRVKVEFDFQGDDLSLPPKTKVFLFRIVQEALQNSSKHAKASQAFVHIVVNHDMLTASIRDNGVGFDVQAVSRDPEKWDHFGLRGMKERAKLLGGEARLQSSKGKGTTITVRIPLGRKDVLQHDQEN
ncbi:sensor histidine kinase [Candidatus Nitronereus thalassa]|uniref:Sensor histidine kinase n=1 Tax=Candidatus Nitronereus thalassa TaxID=3020898 RepID=A0ABU3K6V0_9BACT|nr:sensor histidine kinase [Candidatus Nitronereus thalassa]MDT7042092.1 sensor histidine kinase [Candidatus Nitronereus thalassa]